MNDPAYPANFALQAIVLSAVALGVVACLRRPERRAGAALVGMLACGVIPFFSAFTPVRESAKETVERSQLIQIEPLPQVETMTPVVLLEPAPVSSELPKPHASPIPRLDPVSWILLAWLAGGLTSGLLMGRELIRTRRWLFSLGCPDEVDWEKLRSVLPQGFARDRIRISTDASGPCVIGFRKPRIVIPMWLLETNCHRELDWTLRHELEHLRCHDSRWIHVIRAIRIVHWWNPFLHLLAGAWSQSREQACDLRAIRDADERPDYGHFLLKVAGGKASRFATAMAVTSETKRLRRRIFSLLKSRSPKPSPAGIGWSLMVAGGMIAVAFLASPFGFAQATGAGSPDDDMSWLEPKPVAHLQAAVIISPEPFAKQGEILTDVELWKRRVRFADRRGFSFQKMSPYKMQAGPQIILQLAARGDDSDRDPPWDGKRTIKHFVGWVIHYRTAVSGDELELGVKAAYAFELGTHPAPGLYMNVRSLDDYQVFIGGDGTPFALPVGKKWNDVTMATADGKAMLRSGGILCTSLGEVEKGVHAMCVTGVKNLMPWDDRMSCGFSTLSSKPVGIGKDLRGISLDDLRSEMTPAQVIESNQINERKMRLTAKDNANPENLKLSKLNADLQSRLDEAIRNENSDQEKELRWRIKRITGRIRENCGEDYKREWHEIGVLELKLFEAVMAPIHRREHDNEVERQIALMKEMLREQMKERSREMEKERLDPNKFNHQEQ